MDERNIIANGSRIFEHLFDEMGVSEISELNLLEQFLNQLITRTKGLVITDFLDAGNWDCLGSYYIDHEHQYLFLNWHYYTGTPVIDGFVSMAGYKTSISTVMIKFQHLKMERFDRFPFLTIRGYALKEKEVVSYFKSRNKPIKVFREEGGNFYTFYQIDHGSYIEECFCLDTPIYSILIIPKDTADNTFFSSRILFLYNLDHCEKRILKIEQALKRTDLDEDELCEKANTIRRIFEFVLKIECCFHRHLNPSIFFSEELDVRNFSFRSSYSDLTLGELAKILKPVKSDEEYRTLNTIIRLTNELSHDSGRPVTPRKIQELLSTAVGYIERIEMLLLLP